VVDKKIGGSDRMVKNKKKGKSDDPTIESLSEQDRSDLIECIGTVCFRRNDLGNPILSIKINKDKNPKCAALATKYVLEGREVNIDITSTVNLTVNEDKK